MDIVTYFYFLQTLGSCGKASLMPEIAKLQIKIRGMYTICGPICNAIRIATYVHTDYWVNIEGA